MANLETEVCISLSEDLKRSQDSNFSRSRERLIGDNYNSWGIPVKTIREIVKGSYMKYSKFYSPSENLQTSLCLLSNDTFDCKIGGIVWLGLLAKDESIRFKEIEERIFKKIDNWALVDMLASDVFSASIRRNPEIVSLINVWIDSENRWKRRCAVVTTIKLRKYIKDWPFFSNAIIEKLEDENEPIVQKARAWLRKELNRKVKNRK